MAHKKRPTAWASMFVIDTTTCFWTPLVSANTTIYNPLNPTEAVQPTVLTDKPAEQKSEVTVPQKKKRSTASSKKTTSHKKNTVTAKKQATKKIAKKRVTQKKRFVEQVLAEKTPLVQPYFEGDNGAPPGPESQYVGCYFSLICGTLLFGRVGDQFES